MFFQLNGLTKIVFIAVLLLLKFTFLMAQTDSLNKQISVGIWPAYANYPFLYLEYKKNFNKRFFYNISIEGYYIFNDKEHKAHDYRKYQIATASSLGAYYKFFKICKFSVAAQLTLFLAKQKGAYPTYSYNRARQGLFLGPEFTLDVKVFRIKTAEITVFAKIHSGYGIMHEKYHTTFQTIINTNEKYDEWYGSSFIGLSYRFR
jgi:hypothetical protein